MGKAHPSSHARSYIPNTMFLWLIIQLLETVKPAHQILSLTHRNCWGKPNIWIIPPLLKKNKYGRSQLYRDQIFSHTIYLYNRKFDWCLIIDPIWLVWHTSLTDPLTEPPITYPTHWLRGIFLQKNNSTNDQLFFSTSTFWSSFFSEIMLECWGCGLYTSAAYTRVFTVYFIDHVFLS